MSTLLDTFSGLFRLDRYYARRGTSRSPLMTMFELAVTIVVVFLPAMLTNAYYIRVLENIAIFGLLAMGLNLIFGYTGQVSLGQAGFYALGAYASVLLEQRVLDRAALDTALTKARAADFAVRAQLEAGAVDFIASLAPADRMRLAEAMRQRAKNQR